MCVGEAKLRETSHSQTNKNTSRIYSTRRCSARINNNTTTMKTLKWVHTQMVWTDERRACGRHHQHTVWPPAWILSFVRWWTGCNNTIVIMNWLGERTVSVFSQQNPDELLQAWNQLCTAEIQTRWRSGGRDDIREAAGTCTRSLKVGSGEKYTYTSDVLKGTVHPRTIRMSDKCREVKGKTLTSEM